MSKQAFQCLKKLPTPLTDSQCVLYKHELLICGGYKQRSCYSYHIIKNEYKFIYGFCVVKLINNKDDNEITLLSFGGKEKHALVMKYISVWSNENDNDNDNKINKLKNQTNIINEENNYIGVRALISGSNNNLLFITYPMNNISVFNLNTFQFIKHDILPIENYNKICYHCFILKSEKTKNKIYKIYYAYIYINDIILFFGGWNGNMAKGVSKLVHKYSIQENKWITFQNTLPNPLSNCIAILNEENMYVYIIGGTNGKEHMSTHMNTKVNEWLSEEEMKKMIELKENEDDIDKIIKKDDVKIKLWKEKNEKVISKFGQLSTNDITTWLNNENIFTIYAAIESYLDNHFTDDDIRKREESIGKKHKQDNNEDDLIAYIIMDDGKKELIKMKTLTFEELLRQCYSRLEVKHFQKINKENVKLQLIDMKNNIIETDEDVMRVFENNEPTYKIIWTPFSQSLIFGKIKTIIAISEYNDNNTWKNLVNVKNDIKNFKQLFQKELNYEIICNPSPKMTKQDIQKFLAKLNYQLHENDCQYDGLITIICGHGETGNMLITSDGKSISIDKIRSLFNCHEMESFKDFPKIFIIDACRGGDIPKTHEIIKRGSELSYGHNDDGFLVIWSTTKGHQVADLSLLSECMKDVVTSKYKSGYPFKQMLQDIRTEIRNKKCSEWYCVESQDTTDYDIIFQQRKSI
ncbi:hypothetical protein RFI_35493 [Reticulomyxa filosa]|uniref:Caspase family p20 domain-containing protein n=1 Tax=Reticulomyxa filosa TaxID=46433 RepID=X6LLE6_RETFI|nr:hypothetical protein RFI_35493 [Reticulomyxa filosa]|eukprot:ETO01947.1 hypothetical protein RFI_35493 [Reticulomyxa filosa]